MRIISRVHFFPLALILALVACSQDGSSGLQDGNGQLVSTIEEFDRVAADLQPGDTVVLANGAWTDVELRFRGNGLPGNPITLTAEQPGEVIITGQSNLGFSGEHIVVSGLVFKDGFTPTSEVISFRTSMTSWPTIHE